MLNGQHKKKSLHNEKFYFDVESNLKDYTDWKITTIFYSALHLIKYYALKKFQRTLGDHTDIRSFVGVFLQEISPDYNVLYVACKKARYYKLDNCDDWIDRLNNNLFPKYLKIKEFITKEVEKSIN